MVGGVVGHAQANPAQWCVPKPIHHLQRLRNLLKGLGDRGLERFPDG